jgi:hypothetical protein
MIWRGASQGVNTRRQHLRVLYFLSGSNAGPEYLSARVVPLLSPCRGVAQPGRAPGSGPGGRRFKSSRPDQFNLQTLMYLELLDLRSPFPG